MDAVTSQCHRILNTWTAYRRRWTLHCALCTTKTDSALILGTCAGHWFSASCTNRRGLYEVLTAHCQRYDHCVAVDGPRRFESPSSSASSSPRNSMFVCCMFICPMNLRFEKVETYCLFLQSSRRYLYLYNTVLCGRRHSHGQTRTTLEESA
jgi:hypothetical protein